MNKLLLEEQEVITILRHKQNMLNAIQDKMYSIKKELSNTEEIIEMVSIPSKELSDMPSERRGARDLSDIYERYQIQLDNRKKDFAEIMWALTLKEEQIHRVWNCFIALDEPYFTILNRMYVHNELFDTVQKESGYSLGVFNKYRKKAILSIIEFYDSDIPDSKFLLMANQPKNVVETEDESGQLSFMELIQ